MVKLRFISTIYKLCFTRAVPVCVIIKTIIIVHLILLNRYILFSVGFRLRSNTVGIIGGPHSK